MMNNEKCDCKNYDGGDHRSPLIKLDLPEYEDYRYGGTSHTVCRALRIIGYVAVLVALSYALWRIRVIESKIEANDKLMNITHMLQTSNAFHKRTSRSIQDQMLMNSFGAEKGLMGKDATPWKKPTNKGEFDELVNDLFDKIKAMHDDSDRGHFDRNMKAVFQAWFPVFDALLPNELKEDAETVRKTREVREEYVYNPSHEKSSESASDESDEKGKNKIDYSKSEESNSDESDKKETRYTRSVESDEKGKNKKDDSKSDESNSDESDKKKTRPTRSIETSNNESETYIRPT